MDDFDAIHGFFGLSYSSHLVLPRVLLQSMPQEWQRRFVAVMEEYEDATRGVEQPSSYAIKAAVQKEAWELTDAEWESVGGCRVKSGDSDSDSDDYLYYDEDGTELENWQRIPVPCSDPLPPYNRGRTIIPLGVS